MTLPGYTDWKRFHPDGTTEEAWIAAILYACAVLCGRCAEGKVPVDGCHSIQKGWSMRRDSCPAFKLRVMVEKQT